MKTIQLWKHGMAAAVALLLSTGCGVSKEEASIKEGSPESSNAELGGMQSETNSSRRPQLADIVDTAVAAGQFNTLAQALTAADLVNTLKGPGPFTVFAPTDAAFAKIPAADLNAILADKALLTSILTYHVVAGRLESAAVLASPSLKTLNGESVGVSLRNGAPFINDSKILATDIKASNGVIHVIDTVLLPPAPAQLSDIIDTAVAAGQFKTLAAALTEANLVATLKGQGPFTVFAPTDAAFAKLPPATLNAILADKALLTKILTYHVVAGKLDAAQVTRSNFLTTVEGEKARISVRNGKAFINCSQIVATDVNASNGIIHVIDTVLLPPSLQHN